MSNYRKYYPYNLYQDEQELYYGESGEKDDYIYDYNLPQKTKNSREEFEYNYIEAPNPSKTFRTYFRPICTCDFKRNYTRNKSYNSNKFSKSEYSVTICPYCRGEKGTFNLTQPINQSQNINMNYMSTDINSQYSLNALDRLNKTISPNNNQLIYVMPKNKIHLLFRPSKCTCKKNHLAQSQPKLNEIIFIKRNCNKLFCK